MTDTDEYEGHTEGPWVNEYDEELGEHTIESGDGMVAQRVLGVDADLIAAAPDLLAEVKKLRNYMNILAERAQQHFGYPEWIAFCDTYAEPGMATYRGDEE